MTSCPLRCLVLFTAALLLLACQRQETPQPAAAPHTPPAQPTVVLPEPTKRETRSTEKPAAAAAVVSTPSARTVKPVLFMHAGLTLERGETIADALPVWRRHSGQKPTLLLISNDPALTVPPPELLEVINTALRSESDSSLRKAGNPLQAAPLFLPGMSCDLALRHGWLRELVWVFPQRDDDQSVNLETLRDQLTGNRLIDAKEAATLQLSGKVFSAQLRGLPFRAMPLPSLPDLDGPLLIHIDLSYFQKLYKSEIATPVIPLVGNVLQQLKARRLPVVAVTFSYNHADAGIPLNVRFLGDFIGGLAEYPQGLDQSLPFRWRTQKNILYMETFFQKDDIRRLVERQAQKYPQTAWVQFNRYHTAALFKEENQALSLLAHTVTLDRMYGLEYLLLAERANENQSPEQALRMLQLAGATFPENPFIKLQIAQLAMELGDKETAKILVRELRVLPWSALYYPDLPKQLETILEKLEQ